MYFQIIPEQSKMGWEWYYEGSRFQVGTTDDYNDMRCGARSATHLACDHVRAWFSYDKNLIIWTNASQGMLSSLLSEKEGTDSKGLFSL